MTNDLERLRSWSYRRQLLDRSGAAPLETLHAVVGVYSTHPTAPLALLARSQQLTPANFSALEQQRHMVRLPAMRGSAFLLPTQSAARVFAATRQPQKQLAGRLHYLGLDFETYQRLTPRVLECCALPVTPAELRQCAQSSEDVYLVARVLARDGRILRVGKSLRTDQLKYVSTSAWLGYPLKDVDPGESLAWLAGEYLRAFGPARAADFAWWAGVPRRSAIAALSSLHTASVGGELLVLEEDLDAFQRCSPIEPEAVAVLPKWDSYTMGYAPDGRQRFVDDQFLRLAYTSVFGSPGATSGDGVPLVLRGGRASATWSHRFAGSRMFLTLEPFDRQSVPDHVFEAVGELLGASSIEVTTAAATQGSPRAL